MKKKIVKLIVYLLCCLCFLGFQKNSIQLVWAEEAKTYVAMIDNTSYESLKSAVDSAVDGDEIIIINDSTINLDSNLTAYITVSGKSISIDLNGKSMLININSSLTAFIMTSDSGHLNIFDSSTLKTGLMEIKTLSGSISNFFRNSNDCSITIDSGNYIMDKSVNGAGMIDSRCNTETTSKVGFYINGGNFYLENIGTMSNGSPWLINTSGQNEKGVLVKGGTFNNNINSQYYPFEVDIPNDLAVKNNENGTYTVVPAVCYVDVKYKSGNWYSRSEGYATFKEGFDRVNVDKIEVENGYGSTLSIIKDVYTTRDNFIVPTDRQITIDLYANIFLEDGYEFPNNTTINLCEPESSVSVYVPQPDEPNEEPSEQETENNKSSNTGVLIAVASVLVVAVAGSFIIYFYIKHKNIVKSKKVADNTKVKIEKTKK